MKKTNAVVWWFVFILDILSVVSLYGARLAFIQAKENEKLTIYEKVDMLDYSALWMKFSTVNRIIEPVLIWTIAVFLILLIFCALTKKIDTKRLANNMFFLFLLICISIIPYMFMSIRYEKSDIAMLWIDACRPIYEGISMGIKYGLILFIVSVIFKRIVKKTDKGM